MKSVCTHVLFALKGYRQRGISTTSFDHESSLAEMRILVHLPLHHFRQAYF